MTIAGKPYSAPGRGHEHRRRRVLLVLLPVLAACGGARQKPPTGWTDPTGAGDDRRRCGQATAVYVTDVQRGQILRMAPDGSDLQVLVSGVDANDIDLDVEVGKMYWPNDDKDIMRANLDGSAMESVLRGMPSPYGLALDLVGPRIFWTNQTGNPRLQSSTLRGTDIRDLVPGKAEYMIGISVDPVNRALYWMDGYYHGRVMRASIDGGNPRQIATTVGIATGIDVDPAGGKIYWTEYGNGPHDDAVRRANLDGSNVETLFDASAGLETPGHIAVDPAAGKIYWTDLHAGRVLRGNIDGTGLTTIRSALGYPRGIALARPASCSKDEIRVRADRAAPLDGRCAGGPCVLELTDLSGHPGPYGSVLSLALDETGQPLVALGDRVLVRRPTGEWAAGMADHLVSALVDAGGGVTQALGYPGVHLMTRRGNDFKEVADLSADVVPDPVARREPRFTGDSTTLRTWGPAFADALGCIHFFYAAGDLRGIARRCSRTEAKTLTPRPDRGPADPVAVDRSGRWYVRLEPRDADGLPLDVTEALDAKPAGGNGYLYTQPTTRFGAAATGPGWTELASWKGWAEGLHHHRIVLETRSPRGPSSVQVIDDVQTTPGETAAAPGTAGGRRGDPHGAGRTHGRETNQPLAIFGGPRPLLLYARTTFEETCQVYTDVHGTEYACDWINARGRLFITLPDEGFRTLEVAGTKGLLHDIQGVHAVQDGAGDLHLVFGHFTGQFDRNAPNPSRTRQVAGLTYLKIGLGSAAGERNAGEAATRPAPPRVTAGEAPPGPPSEDEAWPKTTGKVDPALLQAAIAQLMLPARRCVERALSTTPDLHGRIVMQWMVSTSGGVRRARIKESTAGNEDLTRCLLGVFLASRMPRPAGGEAVLELPFLF